MSEIDNLIDGLSEEEIAAYAASADACIVVQDDKTLYVPDELKEIGVQHEHNAETRIIDCPKMWNGVDMSAEGMQIFVSYLLPNGTPGRYSPVTKTVIGDRMRFEWVITNQVTPVNGNLTVIICVKKLGQVPVGDHDEETEEGEVFHWNTKPNRDLVIVEGLEGENDFVDYIANTYPDIITSILSRLDASELEAVETRLQDLDDATATAQEALTRATDLANSIDDALMVGRKDTVNGGEIFNTYEGANKNQAKTGSVAYGEGTAAMSPGQYVAGSYNIPDTAGKYIYIIGNGEAGAKSNAITVSKDGITWYQGGMVIGGSNQDDTTAPFYVKDGIVYFYGKEIKLGGEY